jgi:hypothetical protein
MRLKEIGLQLCTCTWIEIMTGAGVVLYLILAMNDYILAGLAAGIFAPLIVFHFVITWISNRNELVRIEGLKGQIRARRVKMSTISWEYL